MFVDVLKKINAAPPSGNMLVYSRKAVIFAPYESIESVKDTLMGEDLLEIHLFNDDMEYRAIMTESKRFEDGVIEHIADFSNEAEDQDEVYEEKCLLEQGQGELIVLNHLNYDENGMVWVDDYRLRMGGKENA